MNEEPVRRHLLVSIQTGRANYSGLIPITITFIATWITTFLTEKK